MVSMEGAAMRPVGAAALFVMAPGVALSIVFCAPAE
jgi:hypothetical protein